MRIDLTHAGLTEQMLHRLKLAAQLLANRPDIAEHCDNWLHAIREIGPTMAICIGITQMDLAPSLSINAVRSRMRQCGSTIPFFTLDLRGRSQTPHLIRTMLISLQ